MRSLVLRCFVWANALWMWYKSCPKKQNQKKKKREESTVGAAVRVHLPCSAFLCLQVNVVTKLGVELHLEISQHLLYRWHPVLEASDLRLQRLLITKHETSDYMTSTAISSRAGNNKVRTRPGELLTKVKEVMGPCGKRCVMEVCPVYCCLAYWNDHCRLYTINESTQDEKSVCV